MGKLLGMHERSVIGATTEIAVVATTASAQLLSNPKKNGPARFLLICDQIVFLKMGPVAVVATSSDMRLPADSSMVVTVEEIQHSYIAAISNGTDGTLKITRLDDKSP